MRLSISDFVYAARSEVRGPQLIGARYDPNTGVYALDTTGGPLPIERSTIMRALATGDERALVNAVLAAYEAAFPVPEPEPPLDFGPALAAWERP